MLQIHSWPNVILHVDGDAFFASVIQAVNPKLKGKPIVTGEERGVATAVSYEARRLGVKRTTPLFEVRRKFPQCIIVKSDYELYSLFSHKIFQILQNFSPTVEKYSIDEAFADLKGLRKPLHMSYYEMGQNIKESIETKLGISVSVGISLTKTLAKIASSHQRPSGLTLISGRNIENFLKLTLIGDVWGIGTHTSSYLTKLGINTALDFVHKPLEFISENLSKPFLAIWQELNGKAIYKVDPSKKTTYQSITRSHTLNQPTSNPDVLLAELLSHIEEGFELARKLDYKVGKVGLFLKTQQFAYHQTEIKLLTKMFYPLLIREEIKNGFDKIYRKGFLYRTTGCTLSDLVTERTVQETLFPEQNVKEEKASRIYPLVEKGKVNFGISLQEERVKFKGKKPKILTPFIELGEALEIKDKVCNY